MPPRRRLSAAAHLSGGPLFADRPLVNGAGMAVRLSAMADNRSIRSGAKLLDFTEPFGPRYSCVLSYTGEDGWSGLCEGPRGFRSTVVGDTGEECCTVAWQRVEAHHGSEACELSYRYSDEAWEQASAEEAQDPEVRSRMLDCPLCNSAHPDHEHALRRSAAPLN